MEHGTPDSSPFALDARSLALLRVALGLLVLALLAQRAPALSLYFTDDGLVPRAALAGPFAVPLCGFLARFCASKAAATALFCAAAFAAAGLAAGWRPNLMAALAWVLVCGVDSRSPMIVNGGHSLTRQLLFLSCFLRLDGRRGERSIASGVYVANLLVLYWSAFAFKALRPEWRSGEALAMILARAPWFVARLGARLAPRAALCRALTWATLAAEAGLPALLLSRRPRVRATALAALAATHAAFGAVLKVGAFWLADVVALVPLIPSAAWRGAAPAADRRGGPLARAGWAAAAAVALSAAWNAALASGHPHAMPRPLRQAARALEFKRSWYMFSDVLAEPAHPGGWLTARAAFEDGSRADLPLPRVRARGEASDAGGQFASVIDLDYYAELDDERPLAQAAWARWACARAAASSGRAPASVELVASGAPPAEPRVLWSQRCALAGETLAGAPVSP